LIVKKKAIFKIMLLISIDLEHSIQFFSEFLVEKEEYKKVSRVFKSNTEISSEANVVNCEITGAEIRS
jgi:hypothetical protein